MKTRLMSLAGLVLLLLSGITNAAGPSRIFTQEMANITPKGVASVDMAYGYVSAGLDAGIRIGAFGGEVMLNTASLLDDISGFDNSNIGYKTRIGKNLAAYGIISHYDDDAGVSVTDFKLGAAYTMKKGALTFNVNPELVTDDEGTLRGGDTTIFVKGAAIYKLKGASKMSLVAELILENSDFLDTVINLGAHWQPKKNIGVDFIVYSDYGDLGSVTSIPGFVVVTVQF